MDIILLYPAFGKSLTEEGVTLVRVMSLQQELKKTILDEHKKARLFCTRLQRRDSPGKAVDSASRTGSKTLLMTYIEDNEISIWVNESSSMM